MKLSVYVDLRSISWLITKGKEVIAKGIKRIMVDFDHYYEYVAGLPVSKRTNRREKRSARRNRWRYQSRRSSLSEYLAKLGMKQDREYSLKEMLELKVRALSEKLTKSELGAIFMSLQRKRGYKSMRGLANSESSEYLATIKQHEDNLKNYRSISEYLLNNFESVKNIVFMRESYENEFNSICKAQGIEDNTLYNLIYFQRALRRGSIGNCPLEKKRKVCHYSHPDYQYFRILRDVSNIIIFDNNFEEVYIPAELRTKWINYLMAGRNLTKAACCKDLGIKRSTNHSWRSGKNIVGNIVVASIGSSNEQLWQDLFAATDDSRLAVLLEKKYANYMAGKSLTVEDLLDINFHSAGWGEYSHKAITKLIPYLEKGMKLKEAILQAYGIVDMKADMHLRNLIVEQHYDAYKSLVDAIKSKYDITEIALGVCQLIKAGNKQRKSMAKTKRAETKRDATYTDYQYKLLELYDEFNGYSPYEPNKLISREELFTSYNIDHIVPKSKIFEHGKINQCLCRKDLNEEKAMLTGIEFARYLNIEEDYRKFVDTANLSEQKKRYLLMDSGDIPTDILDTNDYITKCFLTQANHAIPNKIINKYCKDWGLNKFSENDIRSSFMKAVTVANFNEQSIEYFNNLKILPEESIGRYNLEQEIITDAEGVLPYIQRAKYYRKTKYGYIPRHQLHDESNYGRIEEKARNTKGEIVTKYFYKIRKSVAGLTAPMVDKILDTGLRKKFKKHFEGKDHAEAIKELTEKPLMHNGKAIKSVAIRVNASDLIKLGRGYVYSAMAHRLDLQTMKPVTLHKYISDLNNGLHYKGKSLQKNDIVELDGEYYFIIGATEPSSMRLRSVYELDAKSIQGSNDKVKKLKLVRINQLGEAK